MIGLTPWMIRIWGAQGYGEFALASSVFVLPSLVDLVVFDPNMAWQANDLLRNDPFLKHRPIIVSTLWLTPARAKALEKVFPDPRFVTAADLKSFGLATGLK